MGRRIHAVAWRLCIGRLGKVDMGRTSSGIHEHWEGNRVWVEGRYMTRNVGGTRGDILRGLVSIGGMVRFLRRHRDIEKGAKDVVRR
jgi:hypothetical protein